MRLTYQNARETELDELKNLWLSCFEDIPEAVELFFNRNINYLHGYTAKADEKIVAAVYLVDCTLSGKSSHYLCGAATLPEYRKRGIMSALIEYALNDAKSRGDRFSILFPANDGLYDFYSRLGYKTSCSVSVAKLPREQMSGSRAETMVRPYENDFERLQRDCFKDNFLYWNNSFIRFACDYYSLYGVRVVYSENALAFFEEENGVATVFYSIYNDIKELKALLLNSTTAEEFVVIGKSGEESIYNSKKEKYGMARALFDDPLPEEIYIGITLN